MGAAAPPILSRLRNDDDGLRRHVLEAVSGGLIARREVTARRVRRPLDAGPPLRGSPRAGSCARAVRIGKRRRR